MRQQRLDLAAKQEHARLLGVKQRFDPHGIPGDEQFLAPAIPDGKGEDAVEAFHTMLFPVQVRGQHHLRVTLGLKLVARLFQLCSQLAAIIQLPVIDDAAFLHVHRLQAVLRVHDAQPRMHQRYKAIMPDPVLIRPAPAHGVLHGLQDVPAHGLPFILIIHNTGNAAHIPSSSHYQSMKKTQNGAKNRSARRFPVL